MERKLVSVAIILVFSFGVHLVSAQQVHAVGGNIGWAIPPYRNFYSDWARNQTFRVDDILYFNFTSNTNAVMELRFREEYESCHTAVPLFMTIKGPASIPIRVPGESYFINIDAISNHRCTLGQRLLINALPRSFAPHITHAVPLIRNSLSY